MPINWTELNCLLGFMIDGFSRLLELMIDWFGRLFELMIDWFSGLFELMTDSVDLETVDWFIVYWDLWLMDSVDY